MNKAMFLRQIVGVALLFAGGCKKESVSQKTRETVEGARQVAEEALSAKSAEPNSFDEVARRLDRGGSLYLYLSTEQWLTGLSQKIVSFRDLLVSASKESTGDREKVARAFDIATSLVKSSGIEDATGFGASSFALEPGLYRNTVFVHHGKGKGTGFLWSVFGKAPHPLAALDFLPAETALAAFSDIDLAQLINVMRQEIERSQIPEAKLGLDQALAKFSAATGLSIDEVLQSLGGSMGLVLTLDEATPITLPIPPQSVSIPMPRLAIFIQVKDDRFFKRIEASLAGNPAIVRIDEPDLRMRTMPVPALPQLSLRATAAQWGGYLIIASDDKLIRDIIATQKSGKGLKATPEFSKLAAGMPADGNAFQIATQRFAATWSNLQRTLVKNQPGSTPEQMALMEKLLAFQKTGATYSVSAHVEDGWLSIGKGTQGASQLIGPMVIAPAAIAAGIALPAFTQVQSRSKAGKSLSNAKQIFLACKLYASDNGGNFPPALDPLVPDYLPNRAIFVSPFAPEVPLGYTYTPGLTDTAPADTVLITDQFSSRAKMRVVVRVDGSGEMSRLPF